MGCAGSMAAAHPAAMPLAVTPCPQDAQDVEIASLRAENTALKEQLAHASSSAGGETAKDAEIAVLQEQLAHTFASLKAEIATLQDELARARSAASAPKGESTVAPAPVATANSLKERADEATRTDSLALLEVARGLQESLRAAVVDGLVLGLGLKSPDDPSDVAATLRSLADNGDELIQQHCVPLLIKAITDSIAGLKVDHVESVSAANSRYADDPKTFTAAVGNLVHFELGLDGYNGRPDGDNVELQMRLEFEGVTTDFKTSNYGGISTNLPTEWEFVVNPDPAKTYPGEVGLPRGDGTYFPGRNRKLIDDLMKLLTSIQAKLTRVEAIAVRLYTGPAYMFLNKGLREGGLAAKLKGIPNFPATCAAFNSAIIKLRKVTPLPANRKLFRGLCGMALPEVSQKWRVLFMYSRALLIDGRALFECILPHVHSHYESIFHVSFHVRR